MLQTGKLLMLTGEFADDCTRERRPPSVLWKELESAQSLALIVDMLAQKARISVPRSREEKPRDWRGKELVLLGEHDRENADRLFGIAWVFGPIDHIPVVVVDLPHVLPP